MTAGRPTGYKPEYCEMLIKHMERGFSFESFAGVIGTCKETLRLYTERHPEFLAAKREAFERSRLFWENMAIENAVEHNIPGEGSRKLNSAVWVFNMKNRFGWTDKQEVKQEVEATNHNFNYDLSKLSDDKLDALTNILKDAIKND